MRQAAADGVPAQVTTLHIAGQTDAQVAEAAFSVLARSMRRGIPLNLLGVPLFGFALAQQGPIPGFFVWAALVLLVAFIYFLVITPMQSRLMAAGTFRPLGRLLIAFNVVFGSLWGLASVMYFEPETARLVVLIAALMALTMTVCFASVRRESRKHARRSRRSPGAARRGHAAPAVTRPVPCANGATYCRRADSPRPT
jgi:hypothetical protein